jgi:hypothetical protein
MNRKEEILILLDQLEHHIAEELESETIEIQRGIRNGKSRSSSLENPNTHK